MVCITCLWKLDNILVDFIASMKIKSYYFTPFIKSYNFTRFITAKIVTVKTVTIIVLTVINKNNFNYNILNYNRNSFYCYKKGEIIILISFSGFKIVEIK